LAKPIPFKSNAEMQGPTYGVGMTAAFGLMGFFVAIDNNWTWSDMDVLDEPTRTRLVGIRVGKNYRWKPEKSATFWIGAMRIEINTDTQGRVKLEDVLPPLNPSQSDALQEWYDSLGPAQRRLIDEINAAGRGTEVSYELDKAPADPMSMAIGGQLELNRAWQVRVEFNVSDARKSLLANLVYRFDL
jgi:hypothetical protein